MLARTGVPSQNSLLILRVQNHEYAGHLYNQIMSCARGTPSMHSRIVAWKDTRITTTLNEHSFAAQDYPYSPPLVRFRTPNGRFQAFFGFLLSFVTVAHASRLQYGYKNSDHWWKANGTWRTSPKASQKLEEYHLGWHHQLLGLFVILPWPKLTSMTFDQLNLCRWISGSVVLRWTITQRRFHISLGKGHWMARMHQSVIIIS